MSMQEPNFIENYNSNYDEDEYDDEVVTSLDDIVEDQQSPLKKIRHNSKDSSNGLSQLTYYNNSKKETGSQKSIRIISNGSIQKKNSLPKDGT